MRTSEDTKRIVLDNSVSVEEITEIEVGGSNSNYYSNDYEDEEFIEGDDYLLQPTYEHCLDIVRFHEPDIVTFCFSKDDTGEPSYELPTPISGTEYLNNNTLLGSACSYIFRRAIVGSLLFSPNISFGEDEEFTPQLFLRA